MGFVLYHSRTVFVEHSQAAEHSLVLLQVLFEGKAFHQSWHDLSENAPCDSIECSTHNLKNATSKTSIKYFIIVRQVND